jgi:4-phospho-D-threonate 3-dehydrogenase / 4-phospho-D-erythronate 3-dehydrogenase
MATPIVAITMGDPAGVGPEVVLKALADPAVRRACRPLVIGDLKLLDRIRNKEGFPEFEPWAAPQPIGVSDGAIPVCALSRLSQRDSRPGRLSAACGEAAYRYIRTAARLVLSGTADAMATAPINKKALHLAGYKYPGHTELLAKLTRTRECRMMLVGERLKVILVTVHLPLMKVAKELTRRRVRITLEIAHENLQKYFGLSHPRLAVAALNPHAGEEGLFGREERQTIGPAIEEAAAKGILAQGPFASDSLFYRAAQGEFDAVVCMYHDQGLIPLKLLHFSDGVQLTLGLPIVRTSADHGTAYDIAGKNRADPTSMREAILLAAQLAARQKKGTSR